jgi:hypothetical protein
MEPGRTYLLGSMHGLENAMNKRISRNGYNVIAGDYAEILRSIKPDEYDCMALFGAMVSKLADMLEGDNEQFDRDRFFKAIYHSGKGVDACVR